jgi:hypothetical protein
MAEVYVNKTEQGRSRYSASRWLGEYGRLALDWAWFDKEHIKEGWDEAGVATAARKLWYERLLPWQREGGALPDTVAEMEPVYRHALWLMSRPETPQQRPSSESF